jgi:beta-glucosidase
MTQPDDAPDAPFRNPELPIEARIDDLLSRMTLDEKVQCLSTRPNVPRLDVVGSGHVEGLHGLAQGGPGKWGKEDPIETTTFPQSIGVASTWDPELVRRMAALEGREARWVFHHHDAKRGGLVVRAPNADLGRDPRWGRTEECFGEDAYFCGVLTQAFVRGLQGDHERYWQAASLMKHFLANSNEDERDRSSSSFDERLFREYYSVAFRKGIEAGSRAFMAAYNSYNGVPCHVHPMLEQIARAEWGQDGIICTDGGGFKLLVNSHRYYPDLAHAAAAVLHAGINQFLDDFKGSVEAALEQGLLVETDVDRAIRPSLRVMVRLGLWDPPELVPYTTISVEPPWTEPESRALVRLVTQKSIVLLKNDAGQSAAGSDRTGTGLLPLDAASLRSVAVVGPLADQVLLDWYSGTPPYTVSPLEGIRARLGERVIVRHASGGDEAVKLAADCDVVLVVVGNHPTGEAKFGVSAHPTFGKEAVDRKDLGLREEPWIAHVLAANPRTVVVLVASFPIAVGWTKEHVPAIVQISHNSQEMGHALADVLFGDVCPGGKLVQTWPRAESDLPPMLDYDLRHGRTYLYFEGEPLFCFGFGLSYTSFSYSNLRTSSNSLRPDGSLDVSVDIRNTGAREGDEVVQLYARYVASHVKRPLHQLVGFSRVTLAPGTEATATMTLNASELAYWDVEARRFVVEAGQVEIQVGRSSRQIELTTTVEVAAR